MFVYFLIFILYEVEDVPSKMAIGVVPSRVGNRACMYFIVHENKLSDMTVLTNCMQNQRNNGPVNAHLRPEIYTNKLISLEW